MSATPGFVLVRVLFPLCETGPNNPEAEIDGGDPIILTGRLNLCGRAGNSVTDDVMRDFAGAISQLSVYDSALTSMEVALLFGAVRGFVHPTIF